MSDNNFKHDWKLYLASSLAVMTLALAVVTMVRMG